MRIVKSKKATENWAPDTMIFFILFVIAIGLSTIALLVIIDSFIIKNLEIHKNVEETLLMERFYNSPDCFAYADDNGRVHPKTVDWGKFNEIGRMEKCLASHNYKHRFKLEIESVLGKKTIASQDWVETKNFELLKKEVFVYNNNDVNQGKLSILVKND